jgi:hypothetical protein
MLMAEAMPITEAAAAVILSKSRRRIGLGAGFVAFRLCMTGVLCAWLRG